MLVLGEPPVKWFSLARCLDGADFAASEAKGQESVLVVSSTAREPVVTRACLPK
jgi:hypothetical protein